MTDKRNRNVMAEQGLRDKIARNFALQVCSSYLDKENKQFVYVIAEGNEMKEKAISFEDACKSMHWKSFKFINNDQTVQWQDDPAWLDYIVELDKKFSKLKPKKSKDETVTVWRSKG